MVRVAAIQVPGSQDVERNVAKAAQHLEAAAQRGARIVCFPELFSLPWFPREGTDATRPPTSSGCSRRRPARWRRAGASC